MIANVARLNALLADHSAAYGFYLADRARIARLASDRASRAVSRASFRLDCIKLGI